MILISVDLPAPLSPTIECTSFGASWKSPRASATTWPKCFWMPRASSRGLGSCGPAVTRRPARPMTALSRREQRALDVLGVEGVERALDVGCGPGALARALAERIGAPRVAAVDPSPAFVAACRERVPGADVRPGAIEKLPFEDASFDLAIAQLVLHF